MKVKKPKLLSMILITLITILMVLLVSGCTLIFGPDDTWAKYHMGDYPDLYTVAINSILGTHGYQWDGRAFPAEIRVVEVDSYGRVLFLYFEGSAISTYSLLISQKRDGEYVYFFHAINFISTIHGGGYNQELFAHFLPEEIEELKERNNWNQGLNLDNTTQARIVNRKESGPISDRALVQAYEIALGDDALGGAIRLGRVTFSYTDNYGRSTYIAWGRWDGESRRHVVLLFQADGSFDVDTGVMELHDLQRYQDELRVFKEINGWNQPFPHSVMPGECIQENLSRRQNVHLPNTADDYPELFTVAINSMLGTRGIGRASGVEFRPLIRVIEVDNYGRTLFLYYEGNGVSTFSLIISQKSDNGYVYFLPHHNFISVRHMSHWLFGSTRPALPLLEEDFSAEEIEELRRRNNWNQELNLESAVRARVVYEKEDGPISDSLLIETYSAVYGRPGGNHVLFWTDFSYTDAYGRAIYVHLVHVWLFQPDGSFDADSSVVRLHDLQRYQDELEVFKEANGWNQPWP